MIFEGYCWPDAPLRTRKDGRARCNACAFVGKVYERQTNPRRRLLRHKMKPLNPRISDSQALEIIRKRGGVALSFSYGLRLWWCALPYTDRKRGEQTFPVAVLDRLKANASIRIATNDFDKYGNWTGTVAYKVVNSAT